jgi:hypothetical protein
LGFGISCSSAPTLANTRGSAAELAAAMLDGLAATDRAALEALALSDAEFRNHVWPDLPAARPERNLPYSYVWGELNQKSGMALSRTLAGHGGARYELRDVKFSRQTTYPGYVVHHDTTLTVRDAAGTERDLRVCGSMIEKDGAWKVFSYVVDE